MRKILNFIQRLLGYPFRLLFAPVFILIAFLSTDFNDDEQYSAFVELTSKLLIP